MFVLWISGLIVLLVLLKYFYLVSKRLLLLWKINSRIKKQNGDIRYSRNPFVSVFKQDFGTDFTLVFQEKSLDVSVLTTPFRRVRYHFDLNNRLLELIVERRGVFLVNPRVPRPSGVMDNVFTIWKYSGAFEAHEVPKYIILNPAPIAISKADGAALTALYNNDTLTADVHVCGLKWFIENIL